MAYVCDERRQALMEARKNFKLGNRFDVARNEVLFANKALLTEGFGDKVAALIVADKLGFDLDAGGVAVVDCGGKAGIELVIRVCQALQIPFVVLHDEDVWSLNDIDDLKKREKQKHENEDEQRKNRRIRDIVGLDDLIYIISLSLEAALGIGRDAHDKPRRAAGAMEKVDIQNPPHELAPLILAVKSLISTTNK